jgi:hypothetical protein
MLSTQLLREQVDRYASGAISAEALEEWLASESWDMRRWVPLGLQRMVEGIQAVFIRYSDGLITEDELSQHLVNRREQLHRSAEITKEVERTRALLEAAIQQGSKVESISKSEAVPLQLTLQDA